MSLIKKKNLYEMILLSVYLIDVIKILSNMNLQLKTLFFGNMNYSIVRMLYIIYIEMQLSAYTHFMYVY